MSKKISKKRLIFLAKVADDLVELGEQLLFVRPDLKDNKKSVFVFLDSDTFDENLDAVFSRYGYTVSK